MSKFFCFFMTFICDNQSIELLIRLNPLELILLPLSKLQQFFDLLLMLHMDLLLLLLQVLLFHTFFLQLFLFFFKLWQILIVFLMEFAFAAVFYCNKEDWLLRWRFHKGDYPWSSYSSHEGWVFTVKSLLAWMVQSRTPHRSAALHDLWAYVTYLRLSIEVGFFMCCQVTRLSESFVAAWILADVRFLPRVRS